MCLLGVRIFNFHILPIFHQKSSKLSPKYAISSQNAERWNTRYFRNYETERRENLTESWEREMQFSDAIWWRHNISKMADGCHIENVFFGYISAPFDRSTRNLEQRWRITCRYRSRDPNCNFRKFKMADGRHFENSFISISQPRIIRFRSNLVGICKSQFPSWIFNKNPYFCKFKMADGRHIGNCYLAISRRHIGRSKRNLEQRSKIRCRYRPRDQNCNFRKFKMADGRHFENSFRLSPYLSREVTDFDQICQFMHI